MKQLVFASLVILILLSSLALAGQTERIAVATKEKSPQAAVSDKAALAPYFLIFDEKGAFVEAIDNPFKTKTLEAGKLLANFLPQQGITAVIGTDYCGDIIGIFKNKGVTAYNFEGSAAQAAANVAQGKVPAALQENTLVTSHKVMMKATSTGQEKIAVAAGGDSRTAEVNAQLASSPYLLVFDQKGKLLEAIENPYRQSDNPGPDVVNYLAGKGVTVMIAGGFGPKILEVMKAKEIWPIAFNGHADDALKKVLH